MRGGGEGEREGAMEWGSCPGTLIWSPQMSSGHCRYMGDKDMDWFTAVGLHFFFFFFELQKYNEENFMLRKVLKNIEVIHKFTCIHICIYTYIPHTYITHTHIHSHTHTHSYIHTLTHGHSGRPTDTRPSTLHTLTHSNPHPLTHNLLCTAHMHNHTHTLIHTHLLIVTPAQPRLSMF